MKKYFELPDGTKYETDNMDIIRLRLRSCDCVIIYDSKRTNFKHSQVKCKMHQKSGQAHLNEVLAHTQSFPKNHPNYPNLTKEDWIDIRANMAKERKKIG